MRTNDTRTDILDIGTELISRNGYTATGLDAVLKGAGVPKGSFYHYFKSKEDFGLAVIDQFADCYDKKQLRFLDDASLPPLRRIRAYLEEGLAYLEAEQFAKGCLIGNLGQELADQNERFRLRLGEIFTDWRERFAECLREAQKRGELRPDADAGELADFILSGWEGAVLRAKVLRSPQPLRGFTEILFSRVLR